MLAVSLQAEPAEQILLSSLHQLIENVEVSLTVVLMNHTGLLQQVTQDVTANCTSLEDKVFFNPQCENSGQSFVVFKFIVDICKLNCKVAQ